MLCGKTFCSFMHEFSSSGEASDAEHDGWKGQAFHANSNHRWCPLDESHLHARGCDVAWWRA